MKGKVKFALAAVLLAVFATAFTGEASALERPDWLGIKWSAKLVRNKDKSLTVKSPDYWQVEIKVSHTNNSKDRDITAIYDKTLTISGEYMGNNRSIKTGKKTITSKKVNKVELWAGQTVSLTYHVPLKDIVENPYHYWEEINNNGIRHGTSGSGALRNPKLLSYDCRVKSKKSD